MKQSALLSKLQGQKHQTESAILVVSIENIKKAKVE